MDSCDQIPTSQILRTVLRLVPSIPLVCGLILQVLSAGTGYLAMQITRFPTDSNNYISPTAPTVFCLSEENHTRLTWQFLQLQRQGYSPPQGQEGAQEHRCRRQEAPGHPQEDERPAHPGHRGGQHVQGGRQRHPLLRSPR